jgi:hypothetical protein
MSFIWLYSKVIAILIISIALTNFVPQKLRLRLFPACFAGLLISQILSAALPESNLIGYGLMGLIYLFTAFLLNLETPRQQKLNITEKFFFVFYAYLTLAVIYAPYISYGLYDKILGFILYFFTGIMVGKFCVMHDQFKHLSRWVAFGAVLVILLYNRNIVHDVDVEIGERLQVEDKLNANLAGLYFVTLLPYAMLTTFSFKETWLTKVIGGVAFVGCSILLFFTGSRNSFIGAVAAVICVILFVNKNKVLSIISVVCGVSLIGFLLSKVLILSDSRILDYSDTTASGRVDVWVTWLGNRTFLQKVFGAGTFYDFSFFKPMVANMHSMYVQIIYEAGYVGMALFLVYLVVHIRSALRKGMIGGISLVLLASCLFSGFGESYPYRSQSLMTLTWGLSMGLLSTYRRQTQNRVPFKTVS